MVEVFWGPYQYRKHMKRNVSYSFTEEECRIESTPSIRRGQISDPFSWASSPLRFTLLLNHGVAQMRNRPVFGPVLFGMGDVESLGFYEYLSEPLRTSPNLLHSSPNIIAPAVSSLSLVLLADGEMDPFIRTTKAFAVWNPKFKFTLLPHPPHPRSTTFQHRKKAA
ncbi:hypothetical protein E6O75_ATG05112 [Venturia nashicola]|uniref:Uncharacterized protein n=1 Tax=Venturia nashicola TaxID=86259 RepID=A0A4Z1PHU3_9PEZI|nr:hypothetical protein E6O75_ATG05112 [Venturia nashicola]